MASFVYVSDNADVIQNVQQKERGRGTMPAEDLLCCVIQDANGNWQWAMPDSTRQLIAAKIAASSVNLKALAKGMVKSVKDQSANDAKGAFYSIPDGVEFTRKTRDDQCIVPVFAGDVSKIAAQGPVTASVFQCGRGRSPSYAKAWKIEKDQGGLWQWVNPGKSPGDFVTEGSHRDSLADLIKALSQQVAELKAAGQVEGKKK